MTALNPAMKKPLTRTRLIGIAAMGFCAVGYVGMGLALLAGRMDVLPMVTAAILAACLAIVGEVGLWVGAACLGLAIFQKRKAAFARFFGRSTKSASRL